LSFAADLSVIIGDFDFVGISILPPETYAIPFVDSDAVLPAPFSTKTFQPVAGRNGQVPKISHAIHLIELPAGRGPEVVAANPPGRWSIHSIEYVLRASVPKRAYHVKYYNAYRYKIQKQHRNHSD
jgi:hypothetical protein